MCGGLGWASRCGGVLWVWWGGAVSGEEGRGGVGRERVGNTGVLLLFD